MDDFMGDVKKTTENVMEAAKEGLKREVDSLDDFEHLGHETSPSQENKTVPTSDLLGDFNTAARDLPEKINRKAEEITGAFPADDFLSFGKTQPTSFSHDFGGKPSEKMDSNLLDFGSENNAFPDRQEADQKLDKFLNEMSQPFIPVKSQDLQQMQEKTDSFMDFERGHPIEPPQKPTPQFVNNSDSIERYSDSEPEEDNFKPSKYDELPKKNELPESFGSTENFKQDAFKDVKDFEPEVVPELPKKDYSIVRPTTAAPEPPKVEKFEDFMPEPVQPEAPKVPEHKPEKVPEKKPEPPVTVEPKKTHDVAKVLATDAEVIFCRMGLDAWFNPERLNPRVESLIYWRDPKKSGPVFGGVLLVLLSLTYFSLISVVAYLSLLGLTGTIAFRIYKNIVQAVQKTGDGHPFKELLEYDVSLSHDKVKEVSEIAVAHLNAAVVELRRLFLVEDLIDSIKFGVMLWALTYLGAWFNGMTLIIIAWVALFSLPKVYETNKTQIDANLDIVRTKVAEITSKVKAAIPIGKKTEEKKEQ